jgi:hypothetical protein
MSNFDAKDALTRELHERATDVGGHPLDLAGVKGRARGIRRRRQIVTGAVAAVVAGVAIPAGLTLTSTPAGYVPQPADQPSATTSPTPTPRGDGTFALTTQDLPRGADPGVSYVVGRRLVTPEGEISMPESYRQITPVLGGWKAVGHSPDDDTLVTLTKDMKVEETAPGGPSFVLSPDGSRILDSERDYHEPGLTIVKDTPTTPGYQQEPMSWWAPPKSRVEPIGYLAKDLDGSQVVYQTVGVNPQVLMGTKDGESVPLKGIIHAEDASPANGLVAGVTTYEPGKVCYGVMEPEVSTSKLVATTCDYSLKAFSPDGRFVLGGTPEADGFGTPTLAVLDARTLEPVVELTPDKDVAMGIPQAVWEDGDTILAAAVEGNDMTMVRIELTGHVEAVTGSYPTADMTLPFWFADAPRW